MESAIIIFHKNALTYYKHRWIKKCLETIRDQTYQNFDIFEISYGDSKNECSIIKYFNIMTDKKLYYWNKPMKDHSYAMNFLLDKVFLKHKYKYCFNINIDDYYDLKRFEIQIKTINKLKVDLVSSNFYYIQESDDNNDKIILKKDVAYEFISLKKKSLERQLLEENIYLKRELIKNNQNLIAHPCVCYTSLFWRIMKKYPHTVPKEDIDLFKKSLIKGLQIHINRKFLLYYRIHNNQIMMNKDKHS